MHTDMIARMAEHELLPCHARGAAYGSRRHLSNGAHQLAEEAITCAVQHVACLPTNHSSSATPVAEATAAASADPCSKQLLAGEAQQPCKRHCQPTAAATTSACKQSKRAPLCPHERLGWLLATAAASSRSSSHQLTPTAATAHAAVPAYALAALASRHTTPHGRRQ